MTREGESGKQKIKIKRIVNLRIRPRRAINRALSIILVVLLLGVTAWVWINSNKKTPMTKKQANLSGTPALTSKPLPRQASTLKKDLKTGPAVKSKPPVTGEEQLKDSIKQAFPGSGAGSAADRTLADKTNAPGELIKKTGHPELILNGVLWSDKPGRRVALINDRYLKEGDSIDGVLVVKIGKDAVTLQFGEVTWTLTVKK